MITRQRCWKPGQKCLSILLPLLQTEPAATKMLNYIQSINEQFASAAIDSNDFLEL